MKEVENLNIFIGTISDRVNDKVSSSFSRFILALRIDVKHLFVFEEHFDYHGIVLHNGIHYGISAITVCDIQLCTILYQPN